MANKPFTSRCINVHNETTSKTNPHAFGLNNVTATQIHDRSISDTVSTCIASNLQPQMPYNNQFYYNCNSDNCNCFNKPQVTYAQPQIIPGGVAFGFNPEPLLQENNIQSFSIGGPPGNPRLQTRQAYQNIFQEPLTLEQQIGLKRLEKQRLELMQIQEYLKKYPCKPQFQHNGQTSITDSNQSQIPLAPMDELPPNLLYPEVDYKAKRRLLTKSPDLLSKSKRPRYTDEDIESCKSDQQTSSTSKLSPDEEKSKQADNTNKDVQSESQENCEPEETASTARRVSCDGLMSSDESVQFTATQACRKVLSRDRNPPTDHMIRSEVVPRCVEFLKRSSNIGEVMRIQEYLKKYPCKPQFQHNGQTSITDSNQSQIPLARRHVDGMPDLTNAVAHLADLRKNLANLSTDKLPPDELPPNQLYPEVYKAKRLLLTKSPDLLNKSKRPLFTGEDIESCKSDQQTSSTSKLSPDEEKSKQQITQTKMYNLNHKKIVNQKKLQAPQEEFHVMFQHNGQTSITDSNQSQIPFAHGMPDLTNAVAALADLRKKLTSLSTDTKLPIDELPPNLLYPEVDYKAKRRLLTKSPDVLNKSSEPEETASTARRVSCDEDMRKFIKICVQQYEEQKHFQGR